MMSSLHHFSERGVPGRQKNFSGDFSFGSFLWVAAKERNYHRQNNFAQTKNRMVKAAARQSEKLKPLTRQGESAKRF
jgi:hypothetical protein